MSDTSTLLNGLGYDSADRGAHVGEQRAVVCCSKIVTLPTNRIAWPSRLCLAGN
jgi:hypothetical protein